MNEKIANIICEIKEDNLLKERIFASNDLLNDLDIDSLQLINIILQVEDEFDIQIDFDEFDMNCLKNLDSFGKYICLQKGGVR
ncbi:acyl carrier protein [Clostridium sp. C8-1-8]|jgi:acyl carrier protein|uniref:acyl carrier protein n=1 Tax=Clostridium sp. C8-1-8 TaxID=2698831 RepID=UPI00136CE06A|nr:acyl carrier protein [Clostridium sp. C8-1-8]